MGTSDSAEDLTLQPKPEVPLGLFLIEMILKQDSLESSFSQVVLLCEDHVEDKVTGH